MTDEHEIAHLRDRYAETFDSRDAAGFAALFAEDGALVVPGGKAITGPQRLARLVESVPANGSRHIPVTAAITVDGDTARCRGPYRLERGETVETGVYDDTFIRTADGWRFARREALPDA
jgi:uncharacterized protein (TIGR02246 family)